MQKKCADQASAAFNEMGLRKEPASYTNRCQQKLNRCFIEIQTIKDRSFHTTVQDAFEGRGYAEYFWINLDGKKYWELKPYLCKVVLLSGEEKACQSQQEFQELVKIYMEQ
jgi:hypothetical protein